MRRNPSSRRHLVFAVSALTACAVVLSAGSALAEADNSSNKAQCRRITRQVAHFVDVAELADSRGDRMWLGSTLSHIERLKQRRVRLCPWYEEPNWAEIYAREIAELAKTAGRAAITFFTFGTYPMLP